MPSGNRAWCFTLNNPTEEDTRIIQDVQTNLWPFLRLFVCQLETGANGTPHYQGYAQFTVQRSLNVVKSLIPRAHFEVAKGTPQQNRNYCTKPDGRLAEPILVGEWGELRDGSGTGNTLKRSDVVNLIQQDPFISETEIINKGGLETLVFSTNVLGIARGYLMANHRSHGITCHLYYGDTGTGKSRLAFDLYPDAYRKASGPWWDGYSGQPVVILDDYDDQFLPIGDLLRAIDRYPMQVAVKGNFVRLVATTFIITSNLLPREWYPNAPPNRLAAVHRRIAKVIAFTSDTVLEHDGIRYLKENDASRGEPFPLPWLAEPEPEPEPSSPELFELTPTMPLLDSFFSDE